MARRHARIDWHWLVLLLVSLLHGCAGTPPHDAATDRDPHATNSTARGELLQAARQAIGTPYRYGGNTPDGFDCSGLVQYVHRRVGVVVPRTTGSQWRDARNVQRSDLLPGDLLFFSIDAAKRSHVGIYEGDGLFIHAPSSGKAVSRASLDNPYWQTRLVGSGTFL